MQVDPAKAAGTRPVMDSDRLTRECRAIGNMYTGKVVRLRLLAFTVALVLATTAVFGVVCEIDCDQVAAVLACHESANSADGPSVRSGPHACNHDHSMGSAVLAASAAARDSVGIFVAAPIATAARSSVTDVSVGNVAMHGPPGLNGRSVSSRLAVLRI